MTLAIIAILLSSCRPAVRYIPVETVRTDSVYRDRILRDSIHVLDSVIVRLRGDTVYADRWRVEYRDRTLRDTVAVLKTDSVGVPYPVERELTRWERAKMDAGGWALCLLGLAAAVGIGYAVRWLARSRR